MLGPTVSVAGTRRSFEGNAEAQAPVVYPKRRIGCLAGRASRQMGMGCHSKMRTLGRWPSPNRRLLGWPLKVDNWILRDVGVVLPRMQVIIKAEIHPNGFFFLLLFDTDEVSCGLELGDPATLPRMWD